VQAIGTDGVGELLANTAVDDVPDAVRGAGNQVVAHVLGVLQIVAVGISVQQRSSLDPVLVGGVDLEALGAGIRGRAALALRAPIEITTVRTATSVR
jgi:hypothetical protein